MDENTKSVMDRLMTKSMVRTNALDDANKACDKMEEEIGIVGASYPEKKEKFYTLKQLREIAMSEESRHEGDWTYDYSCNVCGDGVKGFLDWLEKH